MGSAETSRSKLGGRTHRLPTLRDSVLVAASRMLRSIHDESESDT